MSDYTAARQALEDFADNCEVLLEQAETERAAHFLKYVWDEIYGNGKIGNAVRDCRSSGQWRTIKSFMQGVGKKIDDPGIMAKGRDAKGQPVWDITRPTAVKCHNEAWLEFVAAMDDGLSEQDAAEQRAELGSNTMLPKTRTPQRGAGAIVRAIANRARARR